MSEQGTQQKVSRRGFWASTAFAGALALILAVISWRSPQNDRGNESSRDTGRQEGLSMSEQSAQKKFSRGGFLISVSFVGVLALFFAVVSWGRPQVGGGLICLGALVKVISLTIGAAAKGKDLEGHKSEIEERLGYFDAVAALTAFPALFATGAEMLVNG